MNTSEPDPFPDMGSPPTRDEWLNELLEANEGLGAAQVKIALAAGLPSSSSADVIAAEVARLRSTGDGAVRRDDAVVTWLKQYRDVFDRSDSRWWTLDDLLDDYRLHADTGTPLDQHACEGAHCCEEER